MYYAHSTDDPSCQNWQILRDHLHGVARLAGDFAIDIDAEPAAYLAGLLHDLGKYTSAFQKRLTGGPRVDHATAGAFEIQHLARTREERLFAEVLAYAVAGHHTGLPDKIGATASLNERLNDYTSQEQLDPIWRITAGTAVAEKARPRRSLSRGAPPCP